MTRALAAVVLACGWGGAVAQPAHEVCSGIAEPTQRLECYDKISTPTEGKLAPAAAPQPQPSDTPISTTPRVDVDVDNFGRPSGPVQPVLDRITARIVGKVVDWKRGTQFRLDNGQVWQAVDREYQHFTTIPENPEVEISRSWWGAYWMEIRPVGAKVKVKRVS